MKAGRALRMSYVVASVAGVGFFVMSVGLLGVWPARVLEEQTKAMAPDHPLGLTTAEQRGRVIYGQEGCAYCHSQQVRYTDADMARFGAPTLAWETRLDYPHLWGTRRIGPDLSREAGARPDDWQFTHLFAPRSVVTRSVMPGYPRLFDGGADRPRQDARDLVAYLNSLGRARQLAGPEGEAKARDACQCPDDEMRQMAFHGAVDAHPARARRAGAPPDLPAPDVRLGESLYADHCASCHGPRGEGDGPGAATLDPRPKNLAEHEYTRARLAEILWNGIDGTSMPAWRDRSPAELAALVGSVQALGVAQPDPALPADIGDLGARVYAANCVQCHGEQGRGDGPAAAKLTVPPPDFSRQRPSLAAGQRALRDGVHGSPMAPWTDRLGAAEILAASHHVRGLYRGDARP